jgi:SAM-dependent methyltransferase
MTSCCSFYAHPLVERVLGESFHPGGLGLTRRLARHFRTGPILDLACGSGGSARVLTDEFGLRAIGLDARREGPAIRGDAIQLPFREGSMRGVLVECALSTLGDQPRALAEIRRVLAPGGVLALSDMILEGPLPPDFDAAFAKVACLAGAHGRQGYLSLLGAAGFPRVSHVDCAEHLRSFLDLMDDRLRGVEVVLGSRFELVRRHLSTARELLGDGRLGYAAFIADR